MYKLRNWPILAGVSLFFMIFYATTMYPQDRIFSEYKAAFGDISHPVGTKSIKVYNFFGVLDKTRVMYKADFPQGCDYRVGQVREYSGAKGDIEAFYANQKLKIGEQETGIGVLFIPFDSAGMIDPSGLTRDENIRMEPVGMHTLETLKDDQSSRFLKLSPAASYYFISAGGFSPTDYDIRCQF